MATIWHSEATVQSMYLLQHDQYTSICTHL